MNLYIFFIIYFVGNYGFVGCSEYVPNTDKYDTGPISSIKITFNGLRDKDGNLIGVPEEESYNVNVKHITKGQNSILKRLFLPETLRAINKLNGKVTIQDISNLLDPTILSFQDKKYSRDSTQKKSFENKLVLHSNANDLGIYSEESNPFVHLTDELDSHKFLNKLEKDVHISNNGTMRRELGTLPFNEINSLSTNIIPSAVPVKLILKKPLVKHSSSRQIISYKPLLTLNKKKSKSLRLKSYNPLLTLDETAILQDDKKNNRPLRLKSSNPLLTLDETDILHDKKDHQSRLSQDTLPVNSNDTEAIVKQKPLFLPEKTVVIQPVITQNVSNITPKSLLPLL